MNFLDIFSAKKNCLVIGYLMGTEIFGFRKKLCPWWPFKEGTPHLVPNFEGTFFQTPITWAWNELFGHFHGSKLSSSNKIFEFQPNLCPWKLFKKGNRQDILADFATPFFKTL